MAYTTDFFKDLIITLGVMTAILSLINDAKKYGKTFSIEFFKSIIDNFGIDEASEIIAYMFQKMSRDQDDEKIEQILDEVRQKEQKKRSRKSRRRSRSRSPRHRSRSRSRSPHRHSQLHIPQTHLHSFNPSQQIHEPFLYKYPNEIGTQKISDIVLSAQETIANASSRNTCGYNILSCAQTFHNMIQLFERMTENGMNHIIRKIRLFPYGCSFKVSLFDIVSLFSFAWMQADMEYNYRMITILEKVNKFMIHLLSNFRAIRRQDAVVVQIVYNYEVRELIVKITPAYHGVEKFIGFYMNDGKPHMLIEANTDLEFLEKLNHYHGFIVTQTQKHIENPKGIFEF